MAKAKKPASGKKNVSDTPKTEVPKVDGVPNTDSKKADVPSKATQAAKAKTDAKASAPAKTDGAGKASSGPVTPKADASPAKPEDVKPTIDAKAETTKVGTTGAVKAAETKTDQKTPVADAQPAEKRDPAKGAEMAASKSGGKEPEQKVDAPKAATPASAKVPEAVKESEPSRGGFLPLVFGGLIAGGIGFAVAEMNVLNTRADTDGIKEALARQQEEIAAWAPADLSGVESQISDVAGQVAGIAETATAIETRVTELEDRPIPIADDGRISTEYVESLAAQYAKEQSAVYEQELAALKASVEEQKAEIARLLENALTVEEATANAARDASIQAATAKLTAALGSGEAYDSVIADLLAAGIDDLPAGLTDPAAEGVATLQTLQGEFPATARAALGAARASGVDAGTGGVGGFLKRQLGARSVEPREGDDPDAILSRAEAAVRSGSVGDALTELDALPPEVQSAMEEWLAQARTRAAAEQAVQDLSERLTAN